MHSKVKNYSLVICLFVFLFVVVGGDPERGSSGHGHRGQPIPGGTGRSRRARAAGRRGRRTAHGAVPAAAAPVPPDERRRAGARRLA